MKEFFYLDARGRLLGSVMAFTFRDAHAWLGEQCIRYTSVTQFKPTAGKDEYRQRREHHDHAARFGSSATRSGWCS